MMRRGPSAVAVSSSRISSVCWTSPQSVHVPDDKVMPNIVVVGNRERDLQGTLRRSGNQNGHRVSSCQVHVTFVLCQFGHGDTPWSSAVASAFLNDIPASR